MQTGSATRFRSLAVTLNKMSKDSVDVQHAAKGICNTMARPTGKLEEIEKVWQILGTSVEGDVGDASLVRRRVEH